MLMGGCIPVHFVSAFFKNILCVYVCACLHLPVEFRGAKFPKTGIIHGCELLDVGGRKELNSVRAVIS